MLLNRFPSAATPCFCWWSLINFVWHSFDTLYARYPERDKWAARRSEDGNINPTEKGGTRLANMFGERLNGRKTTVIHYNPKIKREILSTLVIKIIAKYHWAVSVPGGVSQRAGSVIYCNLVTELLRAANLQHYHLCPPGRLHAQLQRWPLPEKNSLLEGALINYSCCTSRKRNSRQQLE